MLLFTQRVTSTLRSAMTLYWNRNHPEFPVLLRTHLEQLGASFIKLGQTLSMRPDFLPISLCVELEKCLHDMPRMTWKEAAGVIEQEFHRSPQSIFKSIAKEPVASASIAQVHKAVLRSGEKVAVKIMKPNVERLMKTDLRVLKLASKIVHRLRLMPNVNVRAIVQEYERFTKEEMDFRKEAKYTQLIAEHEAVDVQCPKVFDAYTTRRVLTLQWMDGTSVSKLIDMKRQGKLEKWLKERKLRVRDIVTSLMNTGLQQPLLSGFFHGDLHPSNILVTDKGEIQWIDFGICGYMDDYLRYNYFYFLLALAHGDPEGCTEFMSKCCAHGHTKSWYDRHRYRREISKIIDESSGKSTKDFSHGELILRIIRSSALAGLDVPQPLILVGRASLAMDGIVQKLDPEWVWAEHVDTLFQTVYQYHLKHKMRRNKFLFEMDQSLQAMTDSREIFLQSMQNPPGLRKEEQQVAAGK
ncbi:MAG: AarF/UbiB family protein [Candidatus Peribacteraceae bacterium]|jgi:ubiquinone biosynthesis protein